MSKVDPFLPLTFAQTDDADEAKLFADELQDLAVGIALLVRKYVRSVGSIDAVDKLENLRRFNDLLVDFTTASMKDESMVISREDYELVLRNVDYMMVASLENGGDD